MPYIVEGYPITGPYAFVYGRLFEDDDDLTCEEFMEENVERYQNMSVAYVPRWLA